MIIFPMKITLHQTCHHASLGTTTKRQKRENPIIHSAVRGMKLSCVERCKTTTSRMPTRWRTLCAPSGEPEGGTLRTSRTQRAAGSTTGGPSGTVADSTGTALDGSGERKQCKQSTKLRNLCFSIPKQG